MVLHGGGHLELKKMHKRDFWGLFGISLGRCPGIIPEKTAFCNFIPGSCVFFSNALALRETGQGKMPVPIHNAPSNYTILGIT